MFTVQPCLRGIGIRLDQLPPLVVVALQCWENTSLLRGHGVAEEGHYGSL